MPFALSEGQLEGDGEAEGPELDLMTSGGGGVGMTSTWPTAMRFASFTFGFALRIAAWVTLNFWAIFVRVSFAFTV